MPTELPSDGLLVYPDGRTRCFWPGMHEDYVAYHDEEWGIPVSDDRLLFEKVCLEGFQSGLSWLTILRKRENFRRAFAEFDFDRVARFGRSDVERLLEDAGIVRHRRKIESTINNAARAVELKREFGSLSGYFQTFRPESAERDPARPLSFSELSQLSKTPASVGLAKDLKRRGWSFVGPTTAYAFMQATGLVNDHVAGCDFWKVVRDKQRAATPRH
ncbi:MAG: DNA-3-methyladenine glycosylase I [Verrucomicrobiales bacterium]